MRSRIGVVTTGGTIGATLKGSLNVDPASTALRERLVETASKHDAEIVIREAMSMISEDIEPWDWSAIFETIEAFLAEGITRIVVTHGTDTLAYSAAALTFLYGHRDAHICLTGAYFRLDHPQSDVPISLLTAFETVLSDCLLPGVYVAFRNYAPDTIDPMTGRIVERTDVIPMIGRVIHGLDVKPMRFDELLFTARYDLAVAIYSVANGLVPCETQGEAITLQFEGPPPTAEQLRAAIGKTLQLPVQPGVDLNKLLPSTDIVDVLIMELYHSGTGPSTDRANGVLDYLKSGHASTVLLAPYASKYLEAPYESTMRLMRAGARAYRDLQPYQLYVFALLHFASGRNKDELLSRLAPWEIQINSTGGIDYHIGVVRKLPPRSHTAL